LVRARNNHWPAAAAGLQQTVKPYQIEMNQVLKSLSAMDKNAIRSRAGGTPGI
jgi:hypothetical protein